MTTGRRAGRATSREDWMRAWRAIPAESCWTHTDQVFLDLLSGLLAEAGPGRILEAGSGSGHVSLRLATGRRRSVLLDYVPRALELGRDAFDKASAQGWFVRGDIRSLPFGDHEYLLTWNSGILQTLPPEERRTVILEMKRVTIPDGWVVAIIPRTEGHAYRQRRRRLEQAGQWPYGDFEAPSPEVRASFESCGFAEVRTRQFGAVDGLGEIPGLGRALSFLLNRTPFGGPLASLADAWIRERSYWSAFAGRAGTGRPNE